MVAPVFVSGRTNQVRFKTIPLFSNCKYRLFPQCAHDAMFHFTMNR